jgi:hypothetical protein
MNIFSVRPLTGASNQLEVRVSFLYPVKKSGEEKQRLQIRMLNSYSDDTAVAGECFSFRFSRQDLSLDIVCGRISRVDLRLDIAYGP